MSETVKHSNCSTKHLSSSGVARCIWPRAEWIYGDGEFALLSRCGPLTVTLWNELEGAERQQEFIDRTGCGGNCTGKHEIVRVQR